MTETYLPRRSIRQQRQAHAVVQNVMGDVSTRPGGIVEAAAGEDLVGRLRCVQDDDVLPTESERVYLAILASPFEELEFSVKTHLVAENKDMIPLDVVAVWATGKGCQRLVYPLVLEAEADAVAYA